MENNQKKIEKMINITIFCLILNLLCSCGNGTKDSNELKQPTPLNLFFTDNSGNRNLKLSGDKKSFTIKVNCTPEQKEYYFDHLLQIIKEQGTCDLTIVNGGLTFTCGGGSVASLCNSFNGKTVLEELEQGRQYSIKPSSTEVVYKISIMDKDHKIIGNPITVTWTQ